MPRLTDPVQIWASIARGSWFALEGSHQGARPGAGARDPARPKRLASAHEGYAEVQGSEGGDPGAWVTDVRYYCLNEG